MPFLHEEYEQYEAETDLVPEMAKAKIETLNEPELADDYPVQYDYVYVVDGKLRRSDIKGTVRDLKRDLNATKVCRCDITGRQKGLKI